jgi:hypothetical protein
MHDTIAQRTLSKVPEVTLIFWVIKIAATTLGETGGDAVTMSWLHADVHPRNGGYLIGAAIFAVLFVVAVIAQILEKKFNPWVYWIAIVASTTIGTVIADFVDRSLGIGYTGGASILLACVLGSLAVWYFTLGSINVQTVPDARHGARRLDRRHQRARLSGRRVAVRRRARDRGDALLLDQCVARLPVLGGVHPHAPARRHRRRFPRQAGA